MFCSHCGTSLPDGSAFCASCGTRLVATASAVPSSAVASPLPAGVVTVSAQGLDRSLRPNGSYDDIQLGVLSAPQLSELFGRLMRNPSQPPGAGDADLCAVNAIVEGPAGTVSFCPGDGAIVTAEGAGPFSPDDAARFAFGATPSVAPRRPKHGGGPVRRPEIPPTDEDRIDPTRLNTGPGAPQVAVSVRRTGFWGSRSAALFFVLALMTGILTVAGAVERMVPLAAVAGLACAGFVALVVMSLAGRNETLRIGIDWTWNALWIARGTERIRYVPNANALRGFRKDSRSVMRSSGRVGGVPVKGKVTVWFVVVVRADGTDFPTFHLDTADESEADRIVAAGTHLIQTS
ncbi:MAG: zinc ribbon domain-containing protein [Planctomycetes bacterium]|nr:zinc ribbon domain-containing protein [Planctomycetota bacterium]